MQSNTVFTFYISSTFRDLQGQRRLIGDYLVNTGLLHVQTLSASADPVLKQCLKDVESCDALILLVANSYGTIVDCPDGKRRSITHCEFLHAREKGKPVLAFFLTYVPPAEEQTSEQEVGLQELIKQLKSLDLLPSAVTERDDLGFEVAAAIQKQVIKLRQAQIAQAPDTSSKQANSTTDFFDKASSAEIYLQVQLTPRGKRLGNFILIPEVFVRSADYRGGESIALPGANPDRLDNVKVDDLADRLRRLGESAQQNLLCLQRDATRESETKFYNLVFELLLPNELLAECISQNPAADGLLQVFRNFNKPYLLRSLERAEKHKKDSVDFNRLSEHWLHANGTQPQLLACSRWPAVTSADTSIDDDIRTFQLSLEYPTGEPIAFVGLMDCPNDRQHIGAILKVVFDSPLPVVLFWLSDGADLRLRWTRAGEILARALPDFPEADFLNAAAGDVPSFQLPEKQPWCTLKTAQKRIELIRTKQVWVDQAILVVDCPQRWPARVNAAARAAPMQVRRSRRS